MIGINLYQAPPYLLEKVNVICTLLKQGKNEYEHVASSIEDKDLRITMLNLAQESNQYACELSSQIYSLGGIPEPVNNEEVYSNEVINHLEDDNAVITFCKVNEKKVVNAYQEVLNVAFPDDGLKKIIRYQLNQMLCIFMQLKQLSSLKFHY